MFAGTFSCERVVMIPTEHGKEEAESLDLFLFLPF